jgi:hypothetical protein
MLEKYLEFRFKNGLKQAYQKYFDEWLSGVTEEQLNYFEREMYNLIKLGIYDPER